MPNVTNIEVLEGKEATGDSTGESKKSTPTKPAESSSDEASGHHWTTRYMRCYRCGGVSWVEYDTRHYHTYDCCYCGARNVF